MDKEYSDKEKIDIILNFCSNICENQDNVDGDIIKMVSDNFWELG